MTVRVVFVGDLGTDRYYSGESRCRALEEQGHDVERFGTLYWGGTSPLSYRINHRLFCGSAVRALNRSLVEVVKRHRPDVLWVDKGLWIYPATLRRLRSYAKSFVHYSTDDILATPSQNWLHRRSIALYDLYLTTNRFNVVEIQQRYGTPTLRVGMGFDARYAHTGGANAIDGSVTRHVVFVGHWEPTNEAVVNALLAAGVPCKVWGANWRKARNPGLRATQTIAQAEYISVFRAGGIGLCCLSKWQRNESTGRSFEIPAIGAALLAEDTHEHRYLYTDGKEAILYSDAQDAVRRVEILLEDISKLQEIAAAGLARCGSLGLTWADHLTREWPIVERVLDGDGLKAEDDDPFWPGFRSGRAYSGPGRSIG